MTNIIESLHNVTLSELNAIKLVNKCIDQDKDSYEKVVNLLHTVKGRVIFCGVGKTGHIGRKLAATFASTGTPSFFLHATEAMHGDLGMVTADDTVILISNSGETKESLAPVKNIKRIGATTIAITGNKKSSLAKACDYDLLVKVDHEADALNLAPTNSSTAALVIGDALACTLSEMKHFTELDFAGFHPGGALGRKLLGDN